MKSKDPRGIGLDSGANHGQFSFVGDSWFLGIGINKYKDFPNLSNAVKDVMDLNAILQKRYGQSSDKTMVLFNEEASRRNIIAAFDQLAKTVKPIDKLLIYYSGHGHLLGTGPSKRGFWVPYDAEEHETATHIRNSTVIEYLEDIDTLHTLLISDSCFSGSLFVRGSMRSSSAAEELEKLKSRWAICSGRHYEEVYDGLPGQNSPFAESILDILRQNSLPKINVLKFADQVIELTRAKCKQLPEGRPLSVVGHKGGQYIFKLYENQNNNSGQNPNNKIRTRSFSKIINEKHIEITSGSFKDPRDNQIYKTIEVNGVTWMAENLNYITKANMIVEGTTSDLEFGSWVYKKNSFWGFGKEVEGYGRLYEWEAVLKACPPGWHIPTREEWRSFLNNFGKDYDERFWALIQGGGSGFNALLGGWRNDRNPIKKFKDLSTTGYYWLFPNFPRYVQGDYKLHPSTGPLGSPSQPFAIIFDRKHKVRELSTTGNYFIFPYALSCRCVKNK